MSNRVVDVLGILKRLFNGDMLSVVFVGCIIVLAAVIFCMCSWRRRYNGLKAVYELTPEDLMYDELYRLLGKPSSQFAAPGTIACHYAFYQGFRKGVFIYAFDNATKRLVRKEKRYF